MTNSTPSLQGATGSSDAKSMVMAWLVERWSTDPLLAVALALSILWFIWWLREKTGLIDAWIPRRKDLSDALQKTIAGTHGGPEVPFGAEFKERIEEIAREQPGHQRAIAKAESWLSWAYSPEPFGRQSLHKALTIAMGYSLLFLVASWAVTGTGSLGSTELLPAGVPWHRRALAMFFLIGWPFLVVSIWRWIGRRRGAVGSLKGSGYWLILSILLGGVGPGGYFLFGGQFRFFAVPVTFAFAVAVAEAEAEAVVFAVVVAVAVAVAVAFLDGAAVGDAVIVAFAVRSVFGRRNAPRWSGTLSTLFGLSLFFVVSATLPLWLTPFAAPQNGWLAGDGLSFVLTFFLCFLPLLNGFFDYLSVGATQRLLMKMRTAGRAGGWWCYWVIDAVVAVALTCALYATVLVALRVFQAMGWGVDGSAVVREFVKKPTSQWWLILLAVTNVVPTVLHWGLLFAGVMSGQVGRRGGQMATHARNVLEGKPLGPIDAISFSSYLVFGGPWFEALTCLMFLSWTVYAFWRLIPWVLSLVT